MTRRIHDVDAIIPPADRGVLGQDGDAAFTLQVVGVHDAFGRGGAFPQRARLFEELVHQGGLAVVHVGDDGDVAQLVDHETYPEV